MAGVGTYKGADGTTLHRITFVHPEDGRPKTIWLGEVSITTRDRICGRVEEIVTALTYGIVPPDDTARWLVKQSKALLLKLAKVNLIEVPGTARKPLTVEQFCNEFITGRPDAKPGTVTNYEQAKLKLVEYFKSKKLQAVTPLDAKQFRSWLKGVQKLAENTCRTHIKNSKLIFGAAKEGKLIEENPFAGHSTALIDRKDRMVFVDRETTERVLAACTTDRWRAIVSLCRYGGLRCPSEVLALKWDDIDWDRSRMTVRSSKTEHQADGGVREVPLFPEVRKALEALMVDPNGAEYVIDSDNRGYDKNLRSVFLKTLKRAKVEPWAKPFQNLRSSRETELSHLYPLHIVVAWLGNSIKTAKKNYLQVCDTDFEKAIGQNINQNINAAAGKARKSSENINQDINQKEPELLGNPTKQALFETEMVPPAGFEPAYQD